MMMVLLVLLLWSIVVIVLVGTGVGGSADVGLPLVYYPKSLYVVSWSGIASARVGRESEVSRCGRGKA